MSRRSSAGPVSWLRPCGRKKSLSRPISSAPRLAVSFSRTVRLGLRPAWLCPRAVPGMPRLGRLASSPVPVALRRPEFPFRHVFFPPRQTPKSPKTAPDIPKHIAGHCKMHAGAVRNIAGPCREHRRTCQEHRRTRQKQRRTQKTQPGMTSEQSARPF